MQCPVGALRTSLLPRAPTAPSASTTTRLFKDNYFSSWATIKPSPYRDRPSIKPAAAGPGRSEHRNVDILIPVARQRESPAGPNVPCKRRTDPAEPPRGTDPQRQPRHSATAKQVRAPGSMRRSFRTHRLCAIPGVSPRAGMRCPVGALRTSLLPRASLRASGRSRGAPKNRSGAGSVRCMHWKRSSPPPRAQRES
jgi:hypothetical protein